MSQPIERFYFHWADWLVFAGMLTISASAGLWHFRKARRSSTEEYLLGGPNMRLFPVSASLIASFISGVTILGTPAEIFNFGTQYWITILSLLFAGIIVSEVYLPVFTTLQLNSAYEYLEIRFNRGVRILISFIFIVDVVLYLSIVVYVPALALNQVSGIDVHQIGAVVCAICIFYTVLGGIRAVVWTDTLQVGVMITAVLVVAGLGTYHVGGCQEVWQKAEKAKRIQFLNFDPSPYTRHTIWTVLIGSWLYSTAYISVNQTMVQRYRSLRDMKTSKLAVGIFTIGVITFISICCWCGLVLVAWYSPPRCDPRASGLISMDDQLLPAFVMEIAGHLHGIPGLFLAGIFGAALSTLSVGLNSTSVVLLEDFVRGCFKLNPSDRCAAIFVKSIIVFLGLLALSFTFLVDKLGGVLAVTGSLAAIAAGTSFGVFTLGMLFPWTNSKGAFVGAIAGFMVAGWASFGANASLGSGLLVPKKIPMDVTYCTANISDKYFQMFEFPDEKNVFPLYRLSYHWFSGLGAAVVIIVGGMVTWITGPNNPAYINRDLLSPTIHRWLPESRYVDRTGRRRTRSSSDVQIRETILLEDTSSRHRPSIVVKTTENQPLTNGPAT